MKANRRVSWRGSVFEIEVADEESSLLAFAFGVSYNHVDGARVRHG
jgi:hypothetical protein